MVEIWQQVFKAILSLDLNLTLIDQTHNKILKTFSLFKQEIRKKNLRNIQVKIDLYNTFLKV